MFDIKVMKKSINYYCDSDEECLETLICSYGICKYVKTLISL